LKGKFEVDADQAQRWRLNHLRHSGFSDGKACECERWSIAAFRILVIDVCRILSSTGGGDASSNRHSWPVIVGKQQPVDPLEEK
jgi:hypothetical protein